MKKRPIQMFITFRFIEFCVIFFCCCMFFSPAVASSWDPPTGSERYWSDPGNWWLNDGPPDFTKSALINVTDEGPVIIDVACTAYASELIVSQFGNSATVEVKPGGSLNVAGNTILGNFSQTGMLRVLGFVDVGGKVDVGFYRQMGLSPRGIGIVEIDGGRLSVGGNMNIGHQGGDGTIDMNGGVVDITGDLDVLNGRVLIHGGVMYAADLHFFPPNGAVDVRGSGTLVLMREYDPISSLTLNGITACGGQGAIEIDYYTSATVVWTKCICPEADLTGDCVVDLYDLAKLAELWLEGAS